MKKYIYTGIFILIAALIVALNISLNSLKKAKDEVKRHEQNERVLLGGLDTLRAKNGDLALQTEALTQSVGEFKRYNAELTREVKNLRIRIKDLQSATSVIIDSDLDTTIPVRDTMYLPDLSAKAFDYKDNYTTINGLISKDSVKIRYHSTDSLFIFHHTEKHRFLFIRWGVKNQWWTIKNSNPNNSIKGFEVIEIKH